VEMNTGAKITVRHFQRASAILFLHEHTRAYIQLGGEGSRAIFTPYS
jgi:hypothetical protein